MSIALYLLVIPFVLCGLLGLLVLAVDLYNLARGSSNEPHATSGDKTGPAPTPLFLFCFWWVGTFEGSTRNNESI